MRAGPTPGVPIAAAEARDRLKGQCAEASLFLAIAGLACAFVNASEHVPEVLILGLIALVVSIACGLIGRSRQGESRLLANLGIGISSLTVLFLCLAPANSGHGGLMRGAQFTNNMKQVGLALHNYQSVYGRFPPAVIRDRQGRPLYSWRVAILPFMECQQLYDDFHLDEPWDSAHNRALLDSSPQVYRGFNTDYDPKLTYIQAFTSQGSAFEGDDGQPITNPDGTSNFPDGTGKTILLAEAAQGVPWSAPLDLDSGEKTTLPNLGGGYQRQRRMFSIKPAIESVCLLFGDASVRRHKWPMAPKTLQALITRNGGEPLPEDP